MQRLHKIPAEPRETHNRVPWVLAFDHETKQPSTVNWASRYTTLGLFLLALAIPSIWVFAGYFEYSLNASLSYWVADGWCADGTETLGVHCFSDYAYARGQFLRSASIWGAQPFAVPYSAIGWAPTIAFVKIGEFAGSYSVGRTLYVIVLCVCLLAPALWVGYGRFRQRGPLALALVGCGTWPFLIAVDRANAIGFAMPFVLLAAIAYVRDRSLLFATAVVISSGLKPQLALLVLLFLHRRRIAYLLGTLSTIVLVNVAAFMFYDGGIVNNIRGWTRILSNYSHYQSLDTYYPYNLGAGRSIIVVGDLVSKVFPLDGILSRSTLTLLLQENSAALGIVIILIVAASILRSGKTVNPIFPITAVLMLVIVVPGLSYGYYSAFLMVPIALVLRDPLVSNRTFRSTPSWSGLLDSSRFRRPDGFWRILLMSLLSLFALVSAPIFLPIPPVYLMNSTIIGDDVALGLIQILAGPLILSILAICCAFMWRRSDSGPVVIDGYRSNGTSSYS